MEEEKLYNFTIKFFENLNSIIRLDDNLLIIEKTDKEFEKECKRNAPYRLAFQRSIKKDDEILIAPGEEFFSSMLAFLKKSGSTTLLKINLDIDAEKIVQKNFIFRNSKLTGVKKVQENNFFYRFIFQTNFIYLNKKEQIVNEIYVHNGKIVNGDLSGYPVEEGKKEDISQQEVQKNYELAKNKIKELINDKTEAIKLELNKSLEESNDRVREYYKKQKEEAKEKIAEEEKKRKQIQESDDILLHEKDERIEKINNNIDKIKENVNEEALKKEEESAMNTERHKHSLNIDNTLVNTTVIYYPVFKLFLRFDNDIKKKLELEYNPLTEEFDDISCNSCSRKIKEINLCLNGHVACDDCIRRCSNCSGYFCKECLNKQCDLCGSVVCKDCIMFCRKCHKKICKKHAINDDLTGEPGCTSCLSECPVCKKISDPKKFKKNTRGIIACTACISKEVGNRIKEEIFR